MVRGSQVALKHVIHDMEARSLVMELRRRAIKRWVSCGNMDCRLKIPHSAKAECGFRTTPEECLYDSGPIGPSIKGLITQYNTIQYTYEHIDTSDTTTYVHPDNSHTTTYVHSDTSGTTTYVHTDISDTTTYVHTDTGGTTTYVHIIDTCGTTTYVHTDTRDIC